MKTTFFFNKGLSIRTFVFSLLAVCATVFSGCSPSAKIEYAVTEASKQCPIAVDETMTVTNIKTEDNNVVYICNVDENAAGFSVEDFAQPTVSQTMKNAMVEYLRGAKTTDKDTESLIRLCKDADYNIVYRFVGLDSNYSMDITIFPYEM